jgi:hypothetical protein
VRKSCCAAPGPMCLLVCSYVNEKMLQTVRHPYYSTKLKVLMGAGGVTGKEVALTQASVNKHLDELIFLQESTDQAYADRLATLQREVIVQIFILCVCSELWTMVLRTQSRSPDSKAHGKALLLPFEQFYDRDGVA